MIIMHENQFLKNQICKFFVFLLILVSSISFVYASDYFTLSVATEDGEQSTLNNPYYLTSTISVRSYTPDRVSIVYGPVSRHVDVVDSSDDYEAFIDFWPIPTDTIIRFESSSDGYETGFSEIYISSKLSDAYESLQQHFSHSENGFSTTCSMSIENNFPFYQCSVIDNFGTSGKFFYYRPEDPNTGEIYDLVYVTNKIYPKEEPSPPPPPPPPPIVCTDNDGDGYAVEGGYCGPIDCDDNDPNIYPGAPEVCNGKDNNCNGIIDGIDVEGDICPAPPLTDVKKLEISVSPTIPLDRDDIVCKVSIDNKNMYQGANDITVFYSVETTKGFSALGDFICDDGNCNQEIIISNIFTEKSSELTCNVWFSYLNENYETSKSVYIHPNPKEEDEPKVERHDLDFNRMRFVDTDVARPGGFLEFQIAMNNRGKPISDMRVNVALLGLDTNERYTLGPFDLKRDGEERGRLIIDIPNDAIPGEYYARISVFDGEYRFVRHRMFFIE